MVALVPQDLPRGAALETPAASSRVTRHMPLLTYEQRLERLRTRLRELAHWLDRAHIDLDEWRWHGRPLALGERWPQAGLHVASLTHPEVGVPPDWPLERVRLELEVGGEGLARVRYSDGGEEAWGVDPYHRRVRLKGSAFSLAVEAVARRPRGEPNHDPRLERARLVYTDGSLERLDRLLQLVVEAGEALGSEEVVDPLLECAEAAVAGLEWPSETEGYLARTADNPWMSTLWTPLDVHGAREPLDDRRSAVVNSVTEQLERDLAVLRERYPQRGSLALSGHAHLDVAWLWPLEETRRKALRTFHTAVGLLDAHPGFLFNQSSAQIYSFVEEDDPALFERVKEKVAEGRWEPIGGMWVEPDINMPAGESLVRQLLYGQRYFAQRFGRTHDVCWLPDCFGFTPALPQLLIGAGISNFMTIKVNWSEMNRFPYDLFWWEGLDGSRVLAHTFDNPEGGYNGVLGPKAVVHTWANFRGKHRHHESLLTIGYGDGGGGVTDEMLERARELPALPAIPRTSFSSVRDFYDRARSDVEGEDVPTWVGELYLEFHRGTLTTQGRTKYLHRRAERDLVAAEVVSAMSRLAGGQEPPSVADLWQVVLRNEFHDVLPGSGVREIYEAGEAELAHVGDAARKIIGAGLEALAPRIVRAGDEDGVLVVNPDLSPRSTRVTLSEPGLGAQRTEDGFVLTTSQDVPALGALVLTEGDVPSEVSAAPDRLENELVRVTIARDGTIAGVFDKRAGREALDGGAGLWAYVDKPRAWDAWDVDVSYTDAAEEIVASEAPRVVESGPHRAAVRVERRWRNSRIVQDVRLWANSPRIDFHTRLDWHDRRFMIKARFPLAVRATHATFETAFGVLQRPTYRNTTWDTAQFEVPGHRFADLSEPGFGVAVLNDGKYGHHALRNELGLTLLRSPVYPDPRADEGRHEFTYALCPHLGGWFEGGVLAEAEDLNRPLLVRAVSADTASSWTALKLEGLPLGLGALKSLEDGGGLVLRTYEPRGARGKVTVSLPEGWSLAAGLDLLEERSGRPNLAFTPFAVRSWLLHRG